jgi:MoxR-like ATPase
MTARVKNLPHRQQYYGPKVRQLVTSATQRVSDEPRPFTAFAANNNVVLLGDPGAGKSHLFRETTAVEAARFLFWFGDKRTSEIPAPPGARPRPTRC